MTFLGLRPNAPTVTLDNALNDGETDANALEFVAAMEALEDLEQFVGEFHVETGAIVANEVNGFVRRGLRSDLDQRFVALAGVLDGVGDEIDPDLPEERGIAVAIGQRADADVQGGPFGSRGQIVEDGLDELGNVNVPAIQRLAAEAGEGEEVIDKLAHALASEANALEVTAALGIELGAEVVEDHLGQPVNGAQGGAEIVGNGVAESLEFLVGGLQLDGALGDALLELGVQMSDFLLGGLAVGDVGADAENFADVAVLVFDDPVGPVDEDAAAVTADVFVDIMLEGGGICADLFHQVLKVAAAAFRGGDDGFQDVATDNLGGGKAEEALAEFVEEGDLSVGGPADDDAVGELDEFAILLLAPGELGLGAASCSLLGEVVEGEGEFAGGFVEEGDFLVLKIADFVGVNVEGAEEGAALEDRKGGGGTVVGPCGGFAPGEGAGIGGKIVADVAFRLANGAAGGAIARDGIVEIDRDMRNVAGFVAGLNDGSDFAGLGIEAADPSGSETAALGQGAADFVEEFVAAAAGDDDVVDLAKGGVKAREARDFALVLFEHGDVARHSADAGDASLKVTDGEDRHREIDDAAIVEAADSLERFDFFAAFDFFKDARFLGPLAFGEAGEDGFADGLGGGDAADFFGAAIPTGNDVVEVDADDDIAGGFDDGGEAAGSDLRLFALAFLVIPFAQLVAKKGQKEGGGNSDEGQAGADI